MSLPTGSDAIINQIFSFQAYNRLKNHFAKAEPAPADLQEGMIWFNKTTGALILQKAGAVQAQIYPPTSVIPEGMIIPWIGGYFTNGSNGGFTAALGANTVVAVNARLNGSGWYVCDGAALNTALSTIFNGAGRYLPNLTDSRFLQGFTAAGAIGGENANSHTHAKGTIAAANESAHTHGYLEGTTSGPSTYGSSFVPDTGTLVYYARDNHTHAWGAWTKTGSAHAHTLSGSTAVPSDTENRPTYLNCFYLMYVLAA